MMWLIFLSHVWICSVLCSGSSLEGNRNIENLLSRLNTRFDQRLDNIEHKIALRIDHLDNRLGRLQSLVGTRLDGIEQNLNLVKLRLDMINEEVHENMNRKWKNFESKIEASVNGLDTKYESKLNLLLREGRRFGDNVHTIFSNVEKRIGSLVGQVNSSLIQFSEMSNTSFHKAAATALGNSITTTSTTPTQTNLISNKVSNMFDDLIERTGKIETALKDSISITNSTRRDVLIALRGASRPGTGTHNNNSPASSSASEATSMAILETLASTESMSTTISRRLSDLTRSIEERFELVSMTLNSFFDSCTRIQEASPLIEEHIASLLERIVDLAVNSTTSLDYQKLLLKLDSIEMKCEVPTRYLPSDPEIQHRETTIDNANNSPYPPHQSSNKISNNNNNNNNNNNRNIDEILENSQHLPEEDKKLLWDNLFPLINSSSFVPEDSTE